jgi:hypothetical protein
VGVDGDLAARVRQALRDAPSVREVSMFGGLAFMVADAMVVCVRGDGDLLVRANPGRADELLAREGARPAEMGAGRPMGPSWIAVGPEGLQRSEDLERWIAVALEHRAQLGGATRPRRPRSRRS